MRISMLVWLAIAGAPLYSQTAVKLRVDATDAPSRLFHVRMTMAVKAGPMTLLYPEWIPGEHGPTGPIVNLVGLKIEGGGKPIAWKRDSVNMYAFHLDVPAGVTSLEVAFDFISPPESEGFSSGLRGLLPAGPDALPAGRPPLDPVVHRNRPRLAAAQRRARRAGPAVRGPVRRLAASRDGELRGRDRDDSGTGLGRPRRPRVTVRQ